MTQPNYQRSYEGISEIEDLDPDAARGRGLRFDLLLGIPLVVCVVLFVCWQWLHGNYRSEQNYLAQEAEGRGDLDAAVLYYSEAAGYGDAEAQIKRLSENVKERDRLYKSAASLADEQEWLLALKDIQGVAKIQPTYKDTVALEANIEEKAISHIYTDALSGTVILKEKADPPGLYYRTGSDWIWLGGSDNLSQLYGVTDSGYILFDSNNAKYTPLQEPGNVSDYSFSPTRQFVAAHNVGGMIKFTRLTIDAALFVPSAMGKDGFWALNFGSSLLDGRYDQSQYLNPVVDAPFHESNMAYQVYSGGDAAYVSLRVTESFATGSAIVAVSGDSNRYLIAEWTGANESGATEDTVVNMYLKAAGETLARLVYSGKGSSIQSAKISPDGRYVMVTAYSWVIRGGQHYKKETTSLVDLAGNGEAKVISEITGYLYPFPHQYGSLRATFVQSGGYAGKILLVEYSEEKTNIKLIDPDKLAGGGVDYIVKQTELLGDLGVDWRIREQNDAGVTITAESYTAPEDGSDKGIYTLHAIVFPVAGEIETYSIRSGSRDTATLMRTSGKYISWSEKDFVMGAEIRWANTQSVSIGKRLIRWAGAFNSVSRDDDIMVYIVKGELHARAYTGDVDILLEKGISAIFAGDEGEYEASWVR
ncbi:MAG: hypothetical protein ABIQ44_07610 [Chloroflexia bacterium]